jgi:hypothetical protein
VIVDLRRYTLKPGLLSAYLSVYLELGLPVQRRHLGEPLGYFLSEVGELNQVVHLWGYQSHADRETRRAAMEADPDWGGYRRALESGQFLLRQDNQLLRSAEFSRI